MKTTMIFSMVTLSLSIVSCGTSSDDSGSNSSTITRTTTGSVEANDVTQLGLSGALQLDLPDALEDSSGSLRLAGSKSIEACLMRESAKQLVQQISMASSMLCHIEAEGSNIPWNTPVILDFSDLDAAAALAAKGNNLQGPTPPGGDEEFPEDGEFPEGEDPTGGEDPTAGTGEEDFSIPMIGIYADDTDGDNIAVYICEGEDEDSMTLAQSFKVTGSKAITVDGESVQVSKGIINIAIGDDTMGTFKGAIGYDTKYTDENVSALKMEVKFGFSGFSFAQKFAMRENGTTTKVSISETGTMDFGAGDPFTFKNSGIGIFDDTNGNVFYSYDGAGNNFSTQACVDSDSYLVGCSDSKFAADGALYLQASDVPAVLKSTFSPAKPSGFDCSTATWTKVTPATDSATIAKHNACDEEAIGSEDGGAGMGDCFSGDGYAQSDEPAEITFSEEDAGDFVIDDIEDPEADPTDPEADPAPALN